jgi:hypothetical protein
MLGGLLVSGALVALADNITAFVIGSGYQTSTWTVPSAHPSGAAWIEDDGYLFVVDTNLNVPSGNGWEFDIQTHVATNRGTGVDEPTGIDYDPDTDTLFITDDDGFIFVFLNFDEPNQQQIVINVGGISSDTEDPVYNRHNDRLYWVDGALDTLFELIPVNGWGGGDDTINSFSLDPLAQDADWEGLAWDPGSGHLLIGNGDLGNEVIYQTDTSLNVINTINATGVPGLSIISGMGASPASDVVNEQSLWVTDRSGQGLFELTFDGRAPGGSSGTTTTQASTSSTGQGSSTTTPTTTPGATTTPTTPGATTTPTTPGSQPTDPDPDLGFVDIAGSGFANAIVWLADEGITKGCNPPANTMFCPDDFVTRGQMATFLVRAFGYTDNGGGNLFIDDNSSVFEGAIDKLATAGITVGCNPPDNDRFCPDRDVTRGEMAAFLGRAFGYTDNGGGDWFIDDDGSVFENAIDRLRTAGVTQGCNPPLNNRYCPNDFVTRGQMAAFLKRALGA